MKRCNLLFVLLLLAACRKDKDDASLKTPTAPATDASTGLPTAAPVASGGHAILGMGDTVRGASIYALDAALVDHDGTSVKLDVFRGKPVIIAMFYSSCPYACPTLISNVKKIEAALAPEVRAEVRVLLVSFDPKNDTPAVLRGVIEKHQLDASRWKLSTGTEDTVRDVAAVLGIKYRDAEGAFNHSSVITLLDRKGVIDLRLDALGDATAPTAKRLAELAH